VQKQLLILARMCTHFSENVCIHWAAPSHKNLTCRWGTHIDKKKVSSGVGCFTSLTSSPQEFQKALWFLLDMLS